MMGRLDLHVTDWPQTVQQFNLTSIYLRTQCVQSYVLVATWKEKMGEAETPCSGSHGHAKNVIIV